MHHATAKAAEICTKMFMILPVPPPSGPWSGEAAVCNESVTPDITFLAKCCKIIIINTRVAKQVSGVSCSLVTQVNHVTYLKSNATISLSSGTDAVEGFQKIGHGMCVDKTGFGVSMWGAYYRRDFSTVWDESGYKSVDHFWLCRKKCNELEGSGLGSTCEGISFDLITHVCLLHMNADFKNRLIPVTDWEIKDSSRDWCASQSPLICPPGTRNYQTTGTSEISDVDLFAAPDPVSNSIDVSWSVCYVCQLCPSPYYNDDPCLCTKYMDWGQSKQIYFPPNTVVDSGGTTFISFDYNIGIDLFHGPLFLLYSNAASFGSGLTSQNGPLLQGTGDPVVEMYFKDGDNHLYADFYDSAGNKISFNATHNTTNEWVEVTLILNGRQVSTKLNFSCMIPCFIGSSKK